MATTLESVAPGLARWSAPHPAWEAGAQPESVEDWPEQVGCTLFDAGDTVAFVDPLLPPDPEELWPALDERVAGRPVSVLTTIRWHGRSRDAFVERYGAAGSVPRGIERFEVRGASETIFWLPGPAALVPGDRLISTPESGLRLCPASWIEDEDIDLEQLREALRPLLGLPVERVLVSHGEPVLADGHAALERALASGVGG